MPRYIDADKLIQRLEREVESCKDPNRGSALGFKMAIFIAQTLADEQVVPRAEIDRLKLELENEALRREKLEQILNSYALQYGTVKDQQEVIDKVKRETAKEIFAEICSVEHEGGFVVLTARELAELKKKYTEENK